MPNSFLKPFIFPVTVLLALAACCSNLNQPTEPFVQGKGTALFKIAAANGPFQKLAKKATLTITASDMLSMSKSLTITDSSVQGTITGIPAGKNRLFTVAVYDSIDTLQYKGSATANVIPDSTVKVSIMVARVSGGVTINGTVVEDTSIPISGLIAWYPFSGKAEDASGNGYHGIVGGATLTVDRFGDLNKAYYFDGTNDSIATTLDINTASDFTVSLWFLNKKNAGYGIIITDASCVGTATGGFSIGVENLKTDTYVMSGLWTGPALVACDTSKWHHVVMVYNKNTRALTRYYDGLHSGDTTISTVANPNLPVTIGRSIGCASEGYFKGYIDDIRIYSAALSASNAAALYHEGGWAGTDTISKSGLVAYYPFNGNASDMSGNGLNATNNGATLTYDRFGHVNSAYHFDGKSAYLNCGTNAAFKAQRFTLSAWVKTDTITVVLGPGNGSQTVLGYTPPTWASGCSWKMLIWGVNNGDSANIPTFAMWIGQAGVTSNFQRVTSSTKISVSKWYHFVGTYDSTTENFYVNGVFVGSKAATLSYSAADSVLIGATKESSNGSLTEFWKGSIDDVRIYSRTLSSSEILALYREGGWTGN